jgi:protocatechuate 3,4-dioxygenase beta subunit
VVPTEIRLARLPLEGSVRDASGVPVAGAAVALHCSEEPERPVRLRRYDPDMGLPWWSYAPGGLACLVTYTQTDANGRFSFAQVSEYPGTVVRVEARQGQRSVVVPFEPGTPLDLVLP